MELNVLGACSPFFRSKACHAPVVASEAVGGGCVAQPSFVQTDFFDALALPPEPFAPEEHVVTLHRALRAYGCFYLPEGMTVEGVEAAKETLEGPMCAFLQVPYLQVAFHRWSATACLLHCFVPGDRERRQVSFEREGSMYLSYRPRLTAAFIFDFQAGYLYMTLPDRRKYPPIEPLLSLFLPEGVPVRRLEAVRMDLALLVNFSASFCRPSGVSAPWVQLFLKEICFRQPGERGMVTTHAFPWDGFVDGMGVLARYQHRLLEAKVMALFQRSCRVVMRLRPQQSALCANLSVETLPIAAALLRALSMETVVLRQGA